MKFNTYNNLFLLWTISSATTTTSVSATYSPKNPNNPNRNPNSPNGSSVAEVEHFSINDPADSDEEGHGENNNLNSQHSSDEPNSLSIEDEEGFDWTLLGNTNSPGGAGIGNLGDPNTSMSMTSFPTLDMDLLATSSIPNTPEGGASGNMGSLGSMGSSRNPTNFLGDGLAYHGLDMDFFAPTAPLMSPTATTQTVPQPAEEEEKEPSESGSRKDSESESGSSRKSSNLNAAAAVDNDHKLPESDNDIDDSQSDPESVNNFKSMVSVPTSSIDIVPLQKTEVTVTESVQPSVPTVTAAAQPICSPTPCNLPGPEPEKYRLTEAVADSDSDSMPELQEIPHYYGWSLGDPDEEFLKPVKLAEDWGNMADRLLRARKEKFLMKLRKKNNKKSMALENKQLQSELENQQDSEEGGAEIYMSKHLSSPGPIYFRSRTSTRTKSMLAGGFAGASSALLLTAALMDATLDQMCIVHNANYGGPGKDDQVKFNPFLSSSTSRSPGPTSPSRSDSTKSSQRVVPVYTGHELDDEEDFHFTDDISSSSTSSTNNFDFGNINDIDNVIGSLAFNAVTKPVFFPVYKETINTGVNRVASDINLKMKKSISDTAAAAASKNITGDSATKSAAKILVPQPLRNSLSLRRISNNRFSPHTLISVTPLVKITPLTRMKNMLKVQKLKSSAMSLPTTNPGINIMPSYTLPQPGQPYYPPALPQPPVTLTESDSMNLQFNPASFNQWVQELKKYNNKSHPLSYESGEKSESTSLSTTVDTTTIPTGIQTQTEIQMSSMVTKTIFDALYSNISSSLGIMDKMQDICEDIRESTRVFDEIRAEEQCDMTGPDSDSYTVENFDKSTVGPDMNKTPVTGVNANSNIKSKKVLSEICPNFSRFNDVIDKKGSSGPLRQLDAHVRLKEQLERKYIQQILKLYRGYKAGKGNLGSDNLNASASSTTSLNTAIKNEIYSTKFLWRLESGLVDEITESSDRATCPEEDLTSTTCLWNKSSNSSSDLNTPQQSQIQDLTQQQSDQHVKVYQQLIDDYVAKLQNLYGYPTCSKPKIQFPIKFMTDTESDTKPVESSKEPLQNQKKFLLKKWLQTGRIPQRLLLDWKNFSSKDITTPKLDLQIQQNQDDDQAARLVNLKRLQGIRDTYIEFYRRFFQDQLKENVMVNFPENRPIMSMKKRSNNNMLEDESKNSNRSSSLSSNKYLQTLSAMRKTIAKKKPVSVWCQKIQEVMYCPRSPDLGPVKKTSENQNQIAGLLTDEPEEATAPVVEATSAGPVAEFFSPVCSKIQEMCPMPNLESDPLDIVLSTTTALLTTPQTPLTRLQILGNLAKEHIRSSSEQNFPMLMRKRKMLGPSPLTMIQLEDIKLPEKMEKPQTEMCNLPTKKLHLNYFDKFTSSIPSSPGGFSMASTRSGSSESTPITPNSTGSSSSSRASESPLTFKSSEFPHPESPQHLSMKTSKFPLLESQISGYLTNGPPKALSPLKLKESEAQVQQKPSINKNRTSDSTIMPYKAQGSLSEMLNKFLTQQKAKPTEVTHCGKKKSIFETPGASDSLCHHTILPDKEQKPIFTAKDAELDIDNKSISEEFKSSESSNDADDTKKQIEDYLELIRKLYGRPKTRNPDYVDKTKLPLPLNRKASLVSKVSSVSDVVAESNNKMKIYDINRTTSNVDTQQNASSSNKAIDLCPDECFTDLCPEECSKLDVDLNTNESSAPQGTVDNLVRSAVGSTDSVAQTNQLKCEKEQEQEQENKKLNQIQNLSHTRTIVLPFKPCDFKRSDSSNANLTQGPLDLSDLEPFCRSIREVIYCPDEEDKPEFQKSNFEKLAGKLLTDEDEEVNLPVCKQIQEMCDYLDSDNGGNKSSSSYNQVPKTEIFTLNPKRKNFGGYLSNPITGGYLTNGPQKTNSASSTTSNYPSSEPMPLKFDIMPTDHSLISPNIPVVNKSNIVDMPVSKKLSQKSNSNYNKFKSPVFDLEPELANVKLDGLNFSNVKKADYKSGFGTVPRDYDGDDNTLHKLSNHVFYKNNNPSPSDSKIVKNLNQKIPVYSSTRNFPAKPKVIDLGPVKKFSKSYDYDFDDHSDEQNIFRTMSQFNIKKKPVNSNDILVQYDPSKPKFIKNQVINYDEEHDGDSQKLLKHLSDLISKQKKSESEPQSESEYPSSTSTTTSSINGFDLGEPEHAEQSEMDIEKFREILEKAKRESSPTPIRKPIPQPKYHYEDAHGDDQDLYGKFSHIQPGMNPKWLRSESKPETESIKPKIQILEEPKNDPRDGDEQNLYKRFSNLQKSLRLSTGDKSNAPFTTMVPSPAPAQKKFKLKLSPEQKNFDTTVTTDFESSSSSSQEKLPATVSQSVDKRIPGVSSQWSPSRSSVTTVYTEPHHRDQPPEPLLLSKRKPTIPSADNWNINILPKTATAASEVIQSTTVPTSATTTRLRSLAPPAIDVGPEPPQHTVMEEDGDQDHDDDDDDDDEPDNSFRDINELGLSSVSHLTKDHEIIEDPNNYYFVNDVDENGHYFFNSDSEVKAKKESTSSTSKDGKFFV